MENKAKNNSVQKSPRRNNFTAMPGVRQRSSICFATAKAVEYLKQGIGQSKRAWKKKLGQSPYIHGYDTLARYTGVFNNFVETVVIPEGVTMLDKITVEHIDAHFDNLLEADCSESSIDVNSSALVKFFTIFRMYNIIMHINKNRYIWKASAMPLSRTQPFGDPERVIASMSTPYQEGAVIQYLTGARVGDIRKVAEWVADNPGCYTVLIRRSKGGRTRTLDFADRLEQFSRIWDAAKELVAYIGGDGRGWIKYLKEYTKAVRNAAKKNSEIYCGPHAFRVNYAEDRYNALSGTGTGGETRETVALNMITEEMGHSRIGMAKYYIPQYRK